MSELLKKRVGEFALKFVKNEFTLGVGSGSTVDFFIHALGNSQLKPNLIVASSLRSEMLLKQYGFIVTKINDIKKPLSVYIDGADEIDFKLNMIKGGGGALTLEKIVASQSERFICIVDESKLVKKLGKFPLPIEIIDSSMTGIIRFLKQKFDVTAKKRLNFFSEHGNPIIDVYGLKIEEPDKLEDVLNQIPGVITNGLFCHQKANLCLISTKNGVQILEDETNL
jgi:ribose 5-phosphate isomerase A